MTSFLVTSASEAESQLLAALFKKMRVKAQVVADAADAPAARRRAALKPAAKSAPKSTFMPKTPAEEVMLEAVLELKEVLAGRKQAQPAEELLRELHELQGQYHPAV